ncbi:MAG: transposase [Caldilineaceae bacterium]|nr:transposase [Caldilineaceae bacterium]
MPATFRHGTASHSQGEYVRGEVHTNSIESVRVVPKRAVHSRWHHVSLKHPARYINEATFRINEGKLQGGHHRLHERVRMLYRWSMPVPHHPLLKTLAKLRRINQAIAYSRKVHGTHQASHCREALYVRWRRQYRPCHPSTQRPPPPNHLGDRQA